MRKPTASGAGKRDAKVGCGLSARFALAGAAVGVLTGVWEATLLYSTPRDPTMLQPDISYVIWFLAPLLGLAVFGFLGTALGLVAARAKYPNARRSAVLAAAGLGMAALYVAAAPDLLTVAHLRDLLAPQRLTGYLAYLLLCYVVVFAAVVLAIRKWWSRTGCFFDAEKSWPMVPLGKLLLVAMVVGLLGLASYPARHFFSSFSGKQSPSPPARGPNIVLIILDAVRADHLSAYGYARPTTPNLDRLAVQGVLFENAVAPSSWSLPSLISIFTGLLPHQHGSNMYVPQGTAIRTLAEVLSSWGYETAGFTANLYYGQSSWGMDQGFQVYEDDSLSLRHNLARTVVGRTLIQPLYGYCIQLYDVFDRRNAREINRDVGRWLQRRSTQPFFLFVHYFDTHDPYYAPPPYDTRFGRISEAALRRMYSNEGLEGRRRLTDEEHVSLIAGYDNCLAFLDDQVGRLFQLLLRSSAWSNTIIIITSDHGDAFGEHASSRHGANLYREVLHVPLIIFGPGIPAGLRIPYAASLRQIFPTVLDLVRSGSIPPHYSLRRYWMPGFRPEPWDDEAVSELLSDCEGPEPEAIISLMTSEWHYLQDARGRTEVYHWPTDPQEKVNLGESPRHLDAVAALRKRLEERVMLSLRPWRRPEYLFAFDRPGHSFLREIAFGRALPPDLPPGQRRVGTTQAQFATALSSTPKRPRRAEEDLLKNLPYR